jgi:hypothetical protein
VAVTLDRIAKYEEEEEEAASFKEVAEVCGTGIDHSNGRENRLHQSEFISLTQIPIWVL